MPNAGMYAPGFWFKPRLTLWAALLWPLSLLYGQLANLHRRWRSRAPYYAGVPVISVGNITVGGTGKTPVVQWLAQHFASLGHQVAIVSRGYGGSLTRQPIMVQPHHTAEQVGDEPLLLARTFAHTPITVWVGRHRPGAVRRAEQAGATIILLDDGFQRADVARTVDILVINGSSGPASAFGNGLTLPAGPLREPLSARARAHFAIVLNEPPVQPLPYYGLPAYRLAVQPTPQSLAPLLGNAPVVAFAGIGQPEKFMRMLVQHKINVRAAIAFPDHHSYTASNLTYLAGRAAAIKGKLATTAKDAAKLPAHFAHVVHITLGGPGKTDILSEISQRLENR